MIYCSSNPSFSYEYLCSKLLQSRVKVVSKLCQSCVKVVSMSTQDIDCQICAMVNSKMTAFPKLKSLHTCVSHVLFQTNRDHEIRLRPIFDAYAKVEVNEIRVKNNIYLAIRGLLVMFFKKNVKYSHPEEKESAWKHAADAAWERFEAGEDIQTRNLGYLFLKIRDFQYVPFSTPDNNSLPSYSYLSIFKILEDLLIESTHKTELKRKRSRSPIRFAGHVYILELENSKYYVGYSSDISARITQHFSGEGSKWTQMHKPIRIYDVQRGDEHIEKLTTITMMIKHGWRNVRGGPYCAVNLESPPKCLKCDYQASHQWEEWLEICQVKINNKNIWRTYVKNDDAQIECGKRDYKTMYADTRAELINKIDTWILNSQNN